LFRASGVVIVPALEDAAAVDEPAIRRLVAEDLDAAFALSSEAGWNQRLEDWLLLLTLEPPGAFAAVIDGGLVGTAIALDYGFGREPGTSLPATAIGGFGWIGMMLVDPAWRGRGVGRRMLDAAIASLPAERPIRLDATPMGRPLYASAGFTDESALTRHILEPSTRHQVGARPRARVPDVSAVSDPDMEDVMACDRLVFGGERGAVLRGIRARAPQYAHILRRGAGRPEYCFGRTGRLFDQIGPVISRDEHGAEALVNAALAGAEGRPLQLDLFDEDAAFSAWLHTVGFRRQRRLFRMCRPAAQPGSQPNPPNQHLLREFAVLGPEFG
jgi:GNAT superfamily N-acetyltransferase